jgi:hypothetical protein
LIFFCFVFSTAVDGQVLRLVVGVHARFGEIGTDPARVKDGDVTQLLACGALAARTWKEQISQLPSARESTLLVSFTTASDQPARLTNLIAKHSEMYGGCSYEFYGLTLLSSLSIFFFSLFFLLLFPDSQDWATCNGFPPKATMVPSNITWTLLDRRPSKAMPPYFAGLAGVLVLFFFSFFLFFYFFLYIHNALSFIATTAGSIFSC